MGVVVTDVHHCSAAAVILVVHFVVRHVSKLVDTNSVGVSSLSCLQIVPLDKGQVFRKNGLAGIMLKNMNTI